MTKQIKLEDIQEAIDLMNEKYHKQLERVEYSWGWIKYDQNSLTEEMGLNEQCAEALKEWLAQTYNTTIVSVFGVPVIMTEELQKELELKK